MALARLGRCNQAGASSWPSFLRSRTTASTAQRRDAPTAPTGHALSFSRLPLLGSPEWSVHSWERPNLAPKRRSASTSPLGVQLTALPLQRLVTVPPSLPAVQSHEECEKHSLQLPGTTVAGRQERGVVRSSQ